MVVHKFPHPSLFAVCKEVTVFDSNLKDILELMWETMKKENGMGLAANQVGLDLRMFVMESRTKEKLFIVNPIVLHKSSLLANLKEGCLSAPGEFIVVPDRASWTHIRYQNEVGDIKALLFDGIHSVCIQHEIEHLNGKSYLQSKGLPRNKKVALAKKWGVKLK